MHKPWHTLLFGLLFFAALACLGYFFPPGGIWLNKDLAVRFPHPQSFYKKANKTPDIKKILKAADKSDSLTGQLTDSPEQNDTTFRIEGAPKPREKPKRDSLLRLITSIQVKNEAALKSFFEALYQLQESGTGQVRVMHYGDSQIEGDRITDVLRQKLQAEFGGAGPGLISLMPLASSIINKITLSPNWDRYNTGTAKDKRVAHNNFGVMAGFTRFSSYKKLYDTSLVLTASVQVNTTTHGGVSARSYKKLRLFYGGARCRTWCEFYDGPALMAADSLEAGGNMRVREYGVGNGSLTHKFKFRSKDSPDFYGLSLQSDEGVLVDNIALRGSSGTFFHLISHDQLRQFYQYLNARLIILQFGGNALPSIRSDTMARNYASYLRGQIAMLKKLAPNASILFIGPADMDVKEGLEYVTHPQLETLRDEIKKVVLESNCAFYDLYDIMGGRNSMAAWVSEKLAATDYIHFSPQGARKVAALFHAALINEYDEYLTKRKSD